MKTLIHTYEPAVLHSTHFTQLIHTIDNFFKVTIEKSFHSFTSINTPLVSDKQLGILIDLYRTTLPNHYQTMKTMYSYQKKENLIKNMHLKNTITTIICCFTNSYHSQGYSTAIILYTLQ